MKKYFFDTGLICIPEKYLFDVKCGAEAVLLEAVFPKVKVT